MNMNFKNGDVLLIHNTFHLFKLNTYISGIIQVFAGCEYNHAAIVLEEHDKLFVVEAVSPTVKKTDLDYWLVSKEYDEIVVQRPSQFPVSEQKLTGRIKRQMGKEYDLLSLLVHLPLMVISEKLGIKRWTGKTQMGAIKNPYCFELVANCYREFFPAWWCVLPKEQYNSPYFSNKKLPQLAYMQQGPGVEREVC